MSWYCDVATWSEKPSVIQVFSDDGQEQDYLPERTCHAELNEGRNAVVCSECGTSMLLEGWEEIKDWGGNTLVNTFKTFPYCPNCGARVITDNEPVEVWQQASADDVTCYRVEQ